MRDTEYGSALIHPEHLQNMQFFVAVAHAKSFSRAALAVQITPSTLSRRIARFEQWLGLRLLRRNTRSVDLTAEGAQYLERAERILEDVRLAHENLRAHLGLASGLLRISIPSSMALVTAMPWLAEFGRLHPDMKIEIDTSPTMTGPVADGFDLSIIDKPLRDSGLTSRRLATLRISLFASPAYLREHGTPTEPGDLAQHECIVSASASKSIWKLRHVDTGETVSVQTKGRYRTNELSLGPLLACDQVGIARAVKNDWQDLVESGRLERVLDKWELEPLELNAVMSTRLLPAKTRLFLDFIAHKLKQVEHIMG